MGVLKTLGRIEQTKEPGQQSEETMEKDADMESELLAQEEFFRTGMKSAAFSVRKATSNDNQQSTQKYKTQYNFKRNDNYVEKPEEMDSEPISIEYEQEDDFYDVYDDTNEFTGFDWSSIKQKEVENEVNVQREKRKQQQEEEEFKKQQKLAQQAAIIEKCRFDFDGKVLTVEERKALPSHLGLHHHGVEPTEAGYALNEIILLIRSTVPSQRTINLNLLFNIISKAKSSDNNNALNQYQQVVGEDFDIIQYLEHQWDLSSTLVLLLNDRHQTVSMAALKTFHQMASSFGEGGVLYALSDRLVSWVQVLEKDSQSLKTSSSTSRPTNKLEGAFLSKIIQKGVLPVLRELIDKFKTPFVESRVMDILVRICRYSYKGAKAVAECDMMVEVLRQHFCGMDVDSTRPEMVPGSKFVEYLDQVQSSMAT